jgi:hypothetical protein
MISNAQAHGATYYLSPSGSDSASGKSSTSPWKTFNFAIPKLSPGDILILLNGTFDGSNSGYPDIRCGTNAVSGTVDKPITMKAENERKAFIKGTGYQYPLFIWSCRYWQFEGIRVESADAANGASQANPVRAFESDYLTFRRLLVQKNNRYQNASVFTLEKTNNSLVEESEFYSFHRNGLVTSGNFNIIRRNYINSRNHADISGGRYSYATDRGDSGITIYPGNYNVIENNIIEDNGFGLDIQAAYGTAIGNKYFGNIALNNRYGASFVARLPNSLATMPQDTFLENQISISSTYYGLYFRANKNTLCKNCMAIDNGLGGFAADKPTMEGDGKPTVFYENSLAVNNGTYGFTLIDQADFGIDSSIAIGQSSNYSPADSAKYINTSSNVDPQLGSCKVFIPDNPMKRAEKNGPVIGANVLYRYEKGVRTDKPLWDPSSGEFTCGAKVAGVNDIAGSSCFDVHKRLNVNTNNCSFPEYYHSKQTGMEAPPNLEVTSVK